MSQISPPIRILLVASVAVLAAYMLFLRPKAEVAPPPAAPAPNVQTGAPAVSQPGKIAEAAKGAVKATNGQLQSEQSVDGVDAGEAATGSTATGTNAAKGGAAAATDGVDLNGLPKPVARAIRKHKTLVLLFWNGRSADDKAVHSAVKKVDRWDGRVFVGSASIRQIAKYGRIARGVDVEQSPTVVVADAKLRAETLVGYVDTLTIDQAVVDALRSTGPLFTDAYLRKVDGVCRDHRSEFNSIPHSFSTSPRQFAAAMRRASELYPAFAADFAAVKAPPRWRAFRTAIVASNTKAVAYYSGIAHALGSHPSSAKVFSVVGSRSGQQHAINRAYRPRMAHARLTRCLN